MIAYIQEVGRQAEPLSGGGWILMILSIGGVTALVVYCYYRIFTSKSDEPDLPGGLGP